jgi:hypothetical protein
MSTSEKFVPLSEAASYELPHTEWRLDLPDYAPADAIGVNLHAINRFARLCGYQRLTVVGDDLGVSEAKPQIDGIDPNGTATSSGRVVATKAPLTEISETDQPPNKNSLLDGFYDRHWSVGRMAINAEGIASTLSQQPGGQLRSNRAWSKQLNTALSQGYRKAAVKNLVTDVPAGANAYSATMLATLTAIDVGMNGHYSFPLDTFNDLAILQFVVRPLVAKFNRGLPAYGRFSFIPNTQVDRALVVNGLSHATRFIKPLNVA